MKFLKQNMLTKILFIVITGILTTVFVVSSIIINISKEIFIETYIKSQEKSFYRICEKLNLQHEELVNIFNQIDYSINLKLFLKNIYSNPQSEARVTYNAKKDIQKAIPSNFDKTKILIISNEGKAYLTKESILNVSTDEILNSKDVKNALKNPQKIQYIYKSNGYTADTKNIPVIMAIKALCFPQNSKPYGVAIAMTTEKDFSNHYEYFTSEYTQFFLANNENTIISSSNKKRIGTKITNNEKNINLKEYLPFYDCTVYGTINFKNALSNFYNEPSLWILCVIICIVVCAMIGYIVKKTFNPLSDLILKMSHARKNNYNQYIEIKGSDEIRELSQTYNTMLADLNHYITELLTIQKEKRKKEIEALQMQINPHYIYNTLASIKLLIYQENTEKATKTIDAFIGLLRNTINNTDETITISKEIECLKNYVLINNTRYGDKVKVDYFIAFGCDNYKIPKMILQPFIENSFFHAFPYDMCGNIKIFIRKVNSKLKIQIIDNGIGIENTKKITKNKIDHFNGIGISNVDARLKLIYGDKYGIKINSQYKKGTTVTILIPINI